LKKVLVIIAALSVSLASEAYAQAKTAKVTKAAATANPVVVLQTFTVADLKSALADANAQTPPDTVAANCYMALIPIVQSGATNPLPTGIGGFQLLQKGRDLKATIANLQSPTGPLAALNTACAPLIVDTQATLIQLGIIGGGVAATSGLTLPLTLPLAIP
jgi:hypothetical protein